MQQPDIKMRDLAAQRRRLDGALDRAIAAVVERGDLVLGPDVGRSGSLTATRTLGQALDR